MNIDPHFAEQERKLEREQQDAAAREARAALMRVAEGLGGAVAGLEVEELRALDGAAAAARQAIRVKRVRHAEERETALQRRADAAEERTRELERELVRAQQEAAGREAGLRRRRRRQRQRRRRRRRPDSRL